MGLVVWQAEADNRSNVRGCQRNPTKQQTQTRLVQVQSHRMIKPKPTRRNKEKTKPKEPLRPTKLEKLRSPPTTSLVLSRASQRRTQRSWEARTSEQLQRSPTPKHCVCFNYPSQWQRLPVLARCCQHQSQNLRTRPLPLRGFEGTNIQFNERRSRVLCAQRVEDIFQVVSDWLTVLG